MRSGLVALALAAAVVGLAGTANAQTLNLPPAPPSIFKQPAIDLGAATIMPDITYSRPVGGYRPLKLDLYKPKQQTGPVPAVIWLHGGGWTSGDHHFGNAFAGTDMPSWLAEMAGRGYVVASVSYRLAGEAPYPAQGQDVRAAIRWLRTNAATYGIDASKVFVMGGSAGGYLAAMAGVSCGEPGLNMPPGPLPAGAPPAAPVVPGSECVQGVVAFYPAVDLTAMAPADNIAKFLGCAAAACPADKLALASILGHIDAKDPPFLILHGDADVTVPITQSRALEAALKAKGVPVEYIVVPRATHVFPNLDPAKRKELIDRIYAFLDKQSGKKN